LTGLETQLSITDDKIQFNEKGYDSMPLHLQIGAYNLAGVPVFKKIAIMSESIPCRKETLTLNNEEDLVYQIPILSEGNFEVGLV
jgi:hypothetical protein